MENVIDDLMSKEDDALIENIFSLRRHIFSFIDRNKLIKFIIQVINDSKIVKFERASDTKYINVYRPAINLLFNVKEAITLNPKSEHLILNAKASREKVIETRASIVHKEIVENYVDMMHQILCKVIGNNLNEEFKYKDWIDEIFTNEKQDIELYITNVQKLPEESKKLLMKDYSLVFGTTTSVVFPPETSEISLDEDNGFTIEFMF